MRSDLWEGNAVSHGGTGTSVLLLDQVAPAAG